MPKTKAVKPKLKKGLAARDLADATPSTQCTQAVCGVLDTAFPRIAPTNPSTNLTIANGISEDDLEALSPQLSGVAGRAIGVEDIRQAKIKHASDLIKLVCGAPVQVTP